MREFWVFYALDTGEYNRGWGEGEPGYAALQAIPEGMGRMVVPRQALAANGDLDLAPIRASYAASIDLTADNVRSMFITNTPGQMATYLEKEAEARGVMAGDEGATVFLTAEANAIGMSVADLAREVVAQADMWRPIGAKIEAARRKAKINVGTATNLGALANAAQINWQAVIAPPVEGEPT